MALPAPPEFFSRPLGAPVPESSHLPSGTPHPRTASAPAANYSLDERRFRASRTGPGRLGGEVARPPLRRSRGTKGPEQRGWLPSQRPCPRQLLIQVLQVCRLGTWPQPLITNWFREGKAGGVARLRRKFLFCPGRAGASPGLGGRRGVGGRPLSLTFPICQPRGWTGSHLGVSLILTITRVNTWPAPHCHV